MMFLNKLYLRVFERVQRGCPYHSSSIVSLLLGLYTKNEGIALHTPSDFSVFPKSPLVNLHNPYGLIQFFF